MLEVYSTASQTLAANQNLTFPTTKYKTNCQVTVEADRQTFKANTCGYYLVQFTASVATTASAAAVVGAQLYVNGVASPEAITRTTSAATTDVQTIAMNTIVKVIGSCPCVNNTPEITIKALGAETITNPIVVITKLK